MFICQECGHEFSDPAIHDEQRYHDGRIVDTLHIHVCPRCYCTQYDEAIHCERCGKPISPTAPYHLCHDCTVQAQQRFVDMLREQFTPGEIKLLIDLYEGEYFEV